MFASDNHFSALAIPSGSLESLLFMISSLIPIAGVSLHST